jgi:hypothetical protein
MVMLMRTPPPWFAASRCVEWTLRMRTILGGRGRRNRSRPGGARRAPDAELALEVVVDVEPAGSVKRSVTRQ